MEPERKGKSPSKPSFSGSMVNFGGVTLNRCVAWLFRPKVFENALHRLRWTISKVWFVCFDIVDGRHPAFTSWGWHSDPLFTRFYTGGAGFLLLTVGVKLYDVVTVVSCGVGHGKRWLCAKKKSSNFSMQPCENPQPSCLYVFIGSNFKS